MKLYFGYHQSQPASLIGELPLMSALFASACVFFWTESYFKLLPGTGIIPILPWFFAFLFSGFFIPSTLPHRPYSSNFTAARTRDRLSKIYGWSTVIAAGYLSYRGLSGSLANLLNGGALESIVTPCAFFAALFIALPLGVLLYSLPDKLHSARLAGRLAAEPARETLTLAGGWIAVILLLISYQSLIVQTTSLPSYLSVSPENLCRLLLASLISTAAFAGLRCWLTPVVPLIVNLRWPQAGLPMLSLSRDTSIAPAYWLVFDRPLSRKTDGALIDQVSLFGHVPIVLVAQPGGDLFGEHLYLADRLGRMKALFPRLEIELGDWKRQLPSAECWAALEYRELYPSDGLLPVAVKTLLSVHDVVVLENSDNVKYWKHQLPGANIAVSDQLIRGIGRCANFGNCTIADRGEDISVDSGQKTYFDCPECGSPLIMKNHKPEKKPLLGIAALVVILFVAWPYINNYVYDLWSKFVITEKFENLLQSEITTTPKTCSLASIETPTKPNWYAVIEIGAKGIKPSAVHFVRTEQGELQPDVFNNTFETQNVTPFEKVSIPNVVQAVCEDIGQFRDLYGNIPIYLVGSSSMAQVPHRAKLVEAITKAIQLPIDFLSTEQESSYLFRGLFVPPIPMGQRCESVVIDIGSGNIKIVYIKQCNPGRESSEEKVVTIDISKFGLVAFSRQTADEVTIGNTFNEAAADTRKKLEDRIDEQIRSQPELTNLKNRVYLVGGAAWALSTLLCLDCPQYRERSITDDQDEYTVIMPKDIEEFYRYVTQNNNVCDPSVENPYLRRDMDGKYNKPWDVNRIEKQQEEILHVCRIFRADSDLLSAAEILRATAKKMNIAENRRLYFVQNTFYTWSRQYLIERIKQQ